MNNYERGWLEAVIDGEGHISLTKEKRPTFKAGFTFIPNVGAANICLPFLERVQTIIGGGHIHMARSGVYNYLMSPMLVKELLPNIRLIIKEEQRELLLEAINIIGYRAGRGRPRRDEDIEKLNQIHQRITWLNRKGKGLEQARQTGKW